MLKSEKDILIRYHEKLVLLAFLVRHGHDVTTIHGEIDMLGWVLGYPQDDIEHDKKMAVLESDGAA